MWFNTLFIFASFCMCAEPVASCKWILAKLSAMRESRCLRYRSCPLKKVLSRNYLFMIKFLEFFSPNTRRIVLWKFDENKLFNMNFEINDRSALHVVSWWFVALWEAFQIESAYCWGSCGVDWWGIWAVLNVHRLHFVLLRHWLSDPRILHWSRGRLNLNNDCFNSKDLNRKGFA